jgi:hypothetical protein
VYLQNLQFLMQYFEANSPVNLRIFLQILQFRKHQFLHIGGGGERAVLCRFRRLASHEAPTWGTNPATEVALIERIWRGFVTLLPG